MGFMIQVVLGSKLGASMPSASLYERMRRWELRRRGALLLVRQLCKVPLLMRTLFGFCFSKSSNLLLREKSWFSRALRPHYGSVITCWPDPCAVVLTKLTCNRSYWPVFVLRNGRRSQIALGVRCSIYPNYLSALQRT